MPVYRSKFFSIAAVACLISFALLLAVRLDLAGKFAGPKILDEIYLESLPQSETWMNIYQKDQKIGYSHKTFSRQENGFIVGEKVFMRINVMGMVQDINLNTRGRLNTDFSLSAIDFVIHSGRFSFSARGRVSGKALAVRTESAGTSRNFKIQLKNKPYLVTGLVHAIGALNLKQGNQVTFDIFDPVSMGQQPVNISVVGREVIGIMGTDRKATKMLLNFKGANQFAWIGERGEILQEKGVLGIRLEKTTRPEALSAFQTGSGEDLTRMVSIDSNVKFENPQILETLKLKISGIDLAQVHLNGGRQSVDENTVTVNKESLDGLPQQLATDRLPRFEQVFLKPSPFIQSDHQKIHDLAQKILRDEGGVPLDRAKRLLMWVYDNIEKRPVVSLPDALSTLENRVGDCNEHAVLLAALARAAGIPARIETGLVYLNGRFYYHAWNLLYVGNWITADASFGQLPADVTHIRFATGSQQQFDLLGVIGRVNIAVIEGTREGKL